MVEDLEGGDNHALDVGVRQVACVDWGVREGMSCIHGCEEKISGPRTRGHLLLCLACRLFLSTYQDFLPRLCCGHLFPELFSNQEMLRAKNSLWQWHMFSASKGLYCRDHIWEGPRVFCRTKAQPDTMKNWLLPAVTLTWDARWIFEWVGSVPPNSSQSEVITIFRTLSRWIVLCHIRTTHSDFWLQPAEFGGSRASIHIHGNLLLDSLFVTALRLAVGSIYYRTLTRLNSCPIAKDLLPFARLLLYQRIYRKNTSGRFTCVPSLINRTQLVRVSVHVSSILSFSNSAPQMEVHHSSVPLPSAPPPKPSVPYSWREWHPNVSITYIRDHRQANHLLQRLNKGPYGLDLEWKPNYVKGRAQNRVALVQIANHEIIFLLQVSAMQGKPS